MNTNSEETLKQSDEATNRILEAINALRQEMNERFEKIEGDLHTMKSLQLSFDVRLDRLEAMLLNVRADVKVLKAEVQAWAKDVMELQQKPV